MRGRSSSKQGKISRVGVTMEKHKVDKVKDEPHLSGAYIRSLVKHLTSINSKDSSTFNGDEKSPETLTTNAECLLDHNNMQQESSPPPPHKKQVRRRQHTSKPYQERLLNMAEARREIVTALKYHRASMKQQESPNNLDVQSSQSSQTHPQLEHYSSLSNPCPSFVPYCYPISSISPPSLPPLYHENINFTLPNQTLGLNLNFHDFKNLDANLYQNPLPYYSTSSSSSSSSSSTSSTAVISEMAVEIPEEVVANSTTSSGGVFINDLHHAMDDEEMEEIRSLGEQHQIEWNDRVNFVMSARWFKFLKTIDTQNDNYNTFTPFDHHFSDDYLQDPGLTWLDSILYYMFNVIILKSNLYYLGDVLCS